MTLIKNNYRYKGMKLKIPWAGLLIVLGTLPVLGQNFINLNSGFPSLTNASSAWGDYDNDGKPDLAMIGFSGVTAEFSVIYHNDGDGLFTPAYILADQVSSGAVGWSDFDHDGDLDLLVSGQTGSGPPAATIVVRNDNSGSFTELPGLLPGVIGVARWIDVNGDGWQDVITCGLRSSLTGDSTRLFINNKNATFTEIPSGIPGYAASDISVTDYDNDGNLDFFLTGGTLSTSMFPVSKLYQNDGAGHFTEVGSFKNLSTGTSKWTDYDNDGDPDLLYDGIDSTASFGFTLLYRNDGGGLFTLMETNLPGTGEPGSVDWADVDNDGDPDVLLSGPVSLMRYDGNNLFTDITQDDFPMGVPDSFADIDNDGDPDILFIASAGGFNATTIFRNDLSTAVPESRGTEGLRISPNPARTNMAVTFPDNQLNGTKLTVTNLAGQVVPYSVSQQLPLQITLDISRLSPGIYFIRSGNNVKKFVKE
jgi:hypothetical protein